MNQLNKLKEGLLDLSTKDLIGIILHLYGLSEENKNFCNAKILKNANEGLKIYKQIIQKYMYPDLTKRSHDISLSKAKRAISEYKKATGDMLGTLELMIYYIECGHKFGLNPIKVRIYQ